MRGGLDKVQFLHATLSGYNMARMAYAIILAPEAVQDLDDLKANLRAVVREGIETHLRHQPEKTSRSRIKRLRKISQPQYRLRSARCGCSTTSLKSGSRCWR